MVQGTPERPRLPPLLILTLNLAIAVVLTLVLRTRVALFCVNPEATASSIALLSLLLFHLIWRYLRPLIEESEGKVNFVVKLRISSLVPLIDTVHPPTLSNLLTLSKSLRLLSIAFTAASVVAVVYYGLTPYSPFQKSDSTPIIQSFSVRERGGEPKLLDPTQAVREIRFGGQLLVGAEFQGPSGAQCEWSTLRGLLEPAEGCSVLYSPPTDGIRDTITVAVQSPCGATGDLATLHINVVQG